ncbi:MAG TPA: shikimate dehydrogenase [Bryobacteraceae bacterium]|nr:shikimate dehydrogenase [Bryobacteraceae bacterium]
MSSLPRNLPRICVALGFPTIAELSRAAEREYKDGNSFLEFRLDYLEQPRRAAEFVHKFRGKYPDTYVLATCRHKQAQGQFSGGLEEQIGILETAIEAGANLIDLEIESAERMKSNVEELRRSVPVIVSFHDFQKTPALDPVLRRLKRIPADAYKIATTARKPDDNLRLIQFVRQQRREPLIALAMSEAGLPTRILGPSRGSLFTYAAPLQAEGTAAGQIPAKAMRSLYRLEKLTQQSRVYGVIACPVAHSKSPLIHNRGFQSRRMDAVYLPFLVPAIHLGEWMKLAGGLPVHGFSVTIPHKQRILRYLDVIDPLAKRIGAVNTVWRRAGKWRGTNTDTDGVIRPLARRLRLANKSILIAGYGGAARAAAIALSDARADVTITGRNLKSAQSLARVVSGVAASLKDAQQQTYDVLIHATPVGMHPNDSESLFQDRVPAGVVLDMVYNPSETVLLKRAKQQGCTVIPGSEMLLEQAIRQFEIWTGESAPRSVMQTALEQAFIMCA